MKPAYYMLAVVLVLIVVSAVVVWKQIPVAQKTSYTPTDTVYVDLDAIVRSHPAHRALASVAAQNARVSGPNARHPSELSRLATAKPDELAERWMRQHLEFVTAQSAIAAFSRLEELRNQRLDLRLDAMRAAASERAQAEHEAESIRLAEKRSLDLRQAAQNSAADRINANLRVAALQAALKIDTPDRPTLESMLVSAKNDLKRLEESLATDNARLEAGWMKQVETLSKSVSDEVNSAISLHAAEATNRIEREVSEARTTFLSTMGSHVTGAAVHLGTGAQPVGRVAGRAFVAPAESVLDINTAAASIEDEVRTAVARQTAALAEKNCWQVTFIPRPGVPDKTGYILRALNRVWAVSKAAIRRGES